MNRHLDATSFFPVGGCLPQAAWPEKTSSKSQDAVALQQIKERGALLMIDRGDTVRLRQCATVAAYLVSPPGAGYGQFEHKADSLIAKFKKKRAERSERLTYEQSHRDYLRSGYLHDRRLSWAVKSLP